MRDPKKRSTLLERIAAKGGLRPGVAAEVARELAVPEADVYGTGSFYHLLGDPDTQLRICTGLSCAMNGANAVLQAARDAGYKVAECSCLAACDQPPAVLRGRDTLVHVTPDDIARADGDLAAITSATQAARAEAGSLELADSDADDPQLDWRGAIGPVVAPGDDDSHLAMNLSGRMSFTGEAFSRALEMGADAVIEEIATSGLQGRGGAGFPAAIKWRGVRTQERTPHYVVLNADEGEPGTFKDREVMLRRPDLVLEGLAIAAHMLGAQEVYLYLRGEFGGPWRVLERAIAAFAENDLFPDVHFHLHAGHGAYICGEETALLEALEGKRGMPRLKPPYPNENGLWGLPTLIQNVETIACVPAIIQRGGTWFRGLGRTEPGSKLYSVSGHVARPGTYELPLGVTMDELAEAAGGYVGEMRAFSPGGASSGFLPASERNRPLDFKSLQEIGSMLGSAGVVVVNDTVDLTWAVREQLRFFEVESCGQCAPCRIGTRFLREAVDRFVDAREEGQTGSRRRLAQVAEVAWEMNEGSICGLGQAAALPLTTALSHFPEEFSDG